MIQQLYGRTIYAPFIGLVLARVDQNGKLLASYPTGILEQSSKVGFTPTYVGKPGDERYIGSRIEVISNDPEATAASIAKFEPLNNQLLYGCFLCMMGGFIDGPFRYNCYPEMLEQRGMRIVHRLTGRTRWPGWITFMDDGWDGLLAACGETGSQYLGQVFQGKNLSDVKYKWAGSLIYGPPPPAGAIK